MFVSEQQGKYTRERPFTIAHVGCPQSRRHFHFSFAKRLYNVEGGQKFLWLYIVET